MTGEKFQWRASDDGFEIVLTHERRQILGKTVEALANDDWPNLDSIVAISGIAQLHTLLEKGDGSVEEIKGGSGYFFTHAAVARLNDVQARGLGLPPTTPFAMKIESRGAVTQNDFWVGWSWLDNGRPVHLEQQGALGTSGDEMYYRIPEPMFGIIGAIEALNAGIAAGFGETQEKARFDAQAGAVSRLFSMLSDDNRIVVPDALSEIRLVHATAFSVNVAGPNDDLQVSPVLFGKEVVEEIAENRTVVDEARQLLPRVRSAGFQALFSSEKQIKSTYVLDSGEYVFIDPSLKPALQMLRSVQRASPEIRKDFVRRPQTFLNQHLRGDRELDDPVLEAIEAEAVDQLFVETRQFSDRVTELGLYERPDLPWLDTEPNQWKPDAFSLYVQGKFLSIDSESLPDQIKKLTRALAEGATGVAIGGADIRPDEKLLEKLEELLPLSPDKPPPKPDEPEPGKPEPPEGRIVLLTMENFESIGYAAQMRPRPSLGKTLPLTDLNPATTLKPHQMEAIKWAADAYEAGWPGVLIADDMGLGKTLEALSFLSLLRSRKIAKSGNPILIVAPVGLLKNWEEEHDRHFASGLGQLTRVFGKHLRELRLHSGQDIRTGVPSLDTGRIADSEWILTTYETLRDYQASFGPVPFSCIVFDEIQKVKNPRSLVTHAAKTVNAKFSIGMTGTPVENTLADLWTIIDILIPGFLGDLREFVLKYPSDDEQKLSALSGLLLNGPPDNPAPVLRRMKTGIIADLPTKTVVQKPLGMPNLQSEEYLSANNDNEAGRLRMIEALHRFRSISLHPMHPTQAADISFTRYIAESARLVETFKVLDEISGRKEKVLIFLESRDLQPVLAEIIKQRYHLDRLPMIINGAVTGEARQNAVNTFQSESGRFDAMILSPRAGGVGITLTTANNVIHLARWWNPAVEDQCSDRVYRIGQNLDVHVYLPQAVQESFGDMSFDLVLHKLLQERRNLAEGVFRPMAIETGDFTSALGIGGAQAKAEVDLDEIDQMDPLQFEDWIGKSLRKNGLKVRMTQRSYDAGADLVVESRENQQVALVQVKHRARSTDIVGIEAMNDLVRAQKSYGKGSARLIAVTNAETYSPTAVAAASKIGARLISRPDLEALSKGIEAELRR